METQLPETLDAESEPVNFVDSVETLDGSCSPISADNNSGNSNKPEEEELDLSDSSPVRTYTQSSSYSRWTQPWSKTTDHNPLDSEKTSAESKSEDEPSPSWIDRPSDKEAETKKFTSVGSLSDSKQTSVETEDEPSPSWVDRCPSGTEAETKKFTSVGSLWDWNRYEEPNLFMLGAGLANLGNTCFLNAVLQTFMHTVPLIQGLKSSDHATPCDSYLEGFCTICALRELIDASLVSRAGVVSPWKFVNNLNYFSSTFHRYHQEDAHEFLQCFLDKLESCDDSRPEDLPPLENDNIVKKAFGGRLVSKLRCCNCGHCSDTYETLIDLSLEIEDVDSLATALESFTKVEKIEDQEIKFTCEKCKEQVSLEKQLVLDKAPSVAALHLKRFKNDGSLVEKLDKYVSFPLDLDLHAYADKNQTNNEEMKYDLYAVIVHTGFSYCSGHYYSFIRTAPNEWYKFDDSRVDRVREDYVLSQEAYILLYAKRGTPWYSEFIEEQKPFIDPPILNTSPKSVLDTTDAVCITSPHLADTKTSCVKESHDTANESSPSSLNKVKDGEGKENVPVLSTPGPHGANNILDTKSLQVNKVSSQSVFKENRSTLDSGATSRTIYITPETPPRSPSPEIYREEPQENNYYIPRDHLRSVDRASSKKKQQQELEQDMERKQACSLIKRSMPGFRGQQLLAAVQGSCSEGSVNKKRRRMEVSPTRGDNNSTSHRRSSFGSMPRTVMAGSLR